MKNIFIVSLIIGMFVGSSAFAQTTSGPTEDQAYPPQQTETVTITPPDSMEMQMNVEGAGNFQAQMPADSGKSTCKVNGKEVDCAELMEGVGTAAKWGFGFIFRPNSQL